MRGLVLPIVACAALLAGAEPAVAHGPDHRPSTATRLPVMGPAPDFALLSQEGTPTTLRQFRGRVVVLSFVYSSCRDICPVLVAKLVDIHLQRKERGARDPVFALITVDPRRDTPAVLKDYAARQGATGPHWYFLTGEASMIEGVTRRYGVVVRPSGDGDFDHTVLTSLIDGAGRLRVQYLGTRFSSDDFLQDLARLDAGR